MKEITITRFVQNRLTMLVFCSVTGAIPFLHAAEQLPQMVVTATKTANTVDKNLAPVTIITRDDIEQLQVKSVPEILSLMPGIDVSSSGGYGSLSSIYIRGSNSDHVLTLIDGVKVGSATSGTLSFEYLPVDQIERIEIVRGPRTSLYGADAIGGVIQIFTRKGEAKSRAVIEAGYGSENTARLSAHLSTSSADQGSYSLGISAFNTDGYNYVGDPAGEEHGYDNVSVSLTAQQQVSDTMTIDGVFLRSQGNADFDGSFVNNTDFIEQVLTLGLKKTFSDNWDSSLRLSSSESNQDNMLGSSQMSFFNTQVYGLNWQNDLTLTGNDLLTLGVDYNDENVDSSTNFVSNSRYNIAAYAQYQFFTENYDWLASIRNDENETYGNYTTGNLALGIPLGGQFRVVASYGTAFKAPTFNDLYYPLEHYPAYSPGGPTSSYSGNPDLRPETSQNFELGLRFEALGQFELNYFNNQIDDLIEYVSEYNTAANNFDGTMKNISQARIDGVEIIWRMNVFNWAVDTNYSWLNPENRDTGKQLPNRSRHLFNLQVHQTRGAWSYGGSLQAASSRYIDTNEQYRLSGFGVVNLQLAYEINKQWKLNAHINNLLDKAYATNARYALSQLYLAPGRNAMLSLKFTP